MKKFWLIIAFACVGIFALPQNIFAKEKMTNSNEELLSIEYDKNIPNVAEKFKNLLATDNAEILAKNVQYPFDMGRGVPKLKNEQEFIEKYHIILPEKLQKYLQNSSLNDWQSGYTLGGICLNECHDVHLTDDGKIIWLKDSDEIKRYRKEYIDKEKKSIYFSLKNYNYNVFSIMTKDWFIRIDDMSGIYEVYTEQDKEKNYRFVAWKKGKNISNKPDIIIDNGYIEKDSEFKYSPKYYIFNNSDFHIIFTSNPIGPDDNIPYYIEIYKNITSEVPEIL